MFLIINVVNGFNRGIFRNEGGPATENGSARPFSLARFRPEVTVIASAPQAGNGVAPHGRKSKDADRTGKHTPLGVAVQEGGAENYGD